MSIPLRCYHVSSYRLYTPLQFARLTDHQDSDHTIMPISIINNIPWDYTLRSTFPIVRAGDLLSVYNSGMLCAVPCAFESVETDIPRAINIAMINLRFEANFRRTEGI